MKIIAKLLPVLICLCLLCLPATAASTVSTVSSAKTSIEVASDGSCKVNMHFNIRLRDDQTLTLPLPKEAKNVRLNDKLKTPSTQKDQLLLELSDLEAGGQSVDVSFDLSNAITVEGEMLKLQVPLLTGLNLSIEEFAFTVIMPEPLTQRPSFSSLYHGADVGGILQISTKGSTISGSCTQKLNDHETLTMQYRGDKTMFPDYSAPRTPIAGWELALALLIVVSILYYLIALIPRPVSKVRTFSPPEGLAAGDIGTCLTGCGMDLTMMVFSWAELGYLSIYMDRRGRVQLRKQMEMGSERSEFENQAFLKLFEHRDTVDGAGMHYALLYRKMAKKSPLLRHLYQSRSGNPQIVRLLAMAAGGCSGVMLSQYTYTASVGTVLLALLMAALCVVLSYLIQYGSLCIPLGNRHSLRLGGAAGLIWILLGLLLNAPVLAVAMVAYEILMGLAAAVGGRRSDEGRQYVAQIRGLRTHLTRGSIFDMQQCLENNPNYFFDLMPYALALGVERKFARRFGKVTLSPCDYLMIPGTAEMTPSQWAVLMRQVADYLNRRQRQLELEHLLQRAGKR